MNIKTAVAAVLTGVAVAGCDGGKEKANDGCGTCCSDEVAVTVNGKSLKKCDLDADVEKVIKAQGDKIPEAQRAYARQMIENQLVQGFVVENVLVAKAKELGFVVTEADKKAREDEYAKSAANAPGAPKTIAEFIKKFPLGEKRGLAEFENGILIDKMIKAEQAKMPKVDYSAEAKKTIDNIVSNNANVASSEAAALAKIKGFKAEIAKAKDIPAKFAEIAKANSMCPSSAKGGDLNEFTPGQMVKEFDQVAFSLPVGKVSDPVKTQFGYHLILVTSKTPAVEAKGDTPAAPAKVRASHILIKTDSVRPVPKADEVVTALKKQAEGNFSREFVMKLISEAKIEASDAFKHILPRSAAKPQEAAKPAEKAAKPAEKAEKTAPVEKPNAK